MLSRAIGISAAVAVVVAGGVLATPTASALPPGPVCPGSGPDATVVLAEGGYCNMLFNVPDPVYGLTYVHCEFGGLVLGGVYTIIGGSNCWRVQQSTGDRIPDPPLNRDGLAVPQPLSP
jgi:hypothetical protein